MKFKLLFSEHLDYSIPIEAKDFKEAQKKADRLTEKEISKKFLISRDVSYCHLE